MIKILIKREETKEVEDEEALLEEDVTVTDGTSNIDSANLDNVTIEDVEEKPKKMKKITETIKEFQLINEHKPIWTRSTSELKEEDYYGFYKSLTNDNDWALIFL